LVVAKAEYDAGFDAALYKWVADWVKDWLSRRRGTSTPATNTEDDAKPKSRPSIRLTDIPEAGREADPKVEQRAVIGPEPDGLGAWRIALPPFATAMAPDPRDGRGQSFVVLVGDMIFERKTLPVHSCLFVHPNDGALEILAGSEGVELLCLQYPLHDAKGESC